MKYHMWASKPTFSGVGWRLTRRPLMTIKQIGVIKTGIPAGNAESTPMAISPVWCLFVKTSIMYRWNRKPSALLVGVCQRLYLVLNYLSHFFENWVWIKSRSVFSYTDLEIVFFKVFFFILALVDSLRFKNGKSRFSIWEIAFT